LNERQSRSIGKGKLILYLDEHSQDIPLDVPVNDDLIWGVVTSQEHIEPYQAADPVTAK
jgi:hypothetical protein